MDQNEIIGHDDSLDDYGSESLPIFVPVGKARHAGSTLSNLWKYGITGYFC